MSSETTIGLAEPTTNPKPAVGDQDECRLRAAAQVEAHEIQSVDVDTLGRLKALAGHGDRLFVWSTPEEWLVNGSRHDAIMSVDLQKEALSALTADERATVDMKPVAGAVAFLSSRLTPAQLVDATALQAVRYLLLMRLGPSARTGRKSGKVSLKAGLIASTASGAIRRMVAIVIRKRLDLLARGFKILLVVDQVPHQKIAGVIGEAMVAIVLAGAVLDKFGGDHVAEMRRNFEAFEATVGPREGQPA